MNWVAGVGGEGRSGDRDGWGAKVDVDSIRNGERAGQEMRACGNGNREGGKPGGGDGEGREDGRACGGQAVLKGSDRTGNGWDSHGRRMTKYKYRGSGRRIFQRTSARVWQLQLVPLSTLLSCLARLSLIIPHGPASAHHPTPPPGRPFHAIPILLFLQPRLLHPLLLWLFPHLLAPWLLRKRQSLPPRFIPRSTLGSARVRPIYSLVLLETSFSPSSSSFFFPVAPPTSAVQERYLPPSSPTEVPS
jgi:hypothetical protein